ncbi:MAG: protein translocase subunit SecF [Candidatus Paceibacterota bacterium]
MFIIKYRKIFFALSGLLVIGSLLAVGIFGLNLGIDFTGGSILEVTYEAGRPELPLIRDSLADLDLGQAGIQLSGDQSVIIRLRDITSDEKSALDEVLTFNGEFTFTEDRYSAIGPSLGSELASKGLIAIALVVSLIILFIAFAFRGVSHKVNSWKYGLVAIVTLSHDIIIPLGLIAVLGQTVGAEVDALFLTALLAILGLSVNDTIVVFDRIRENLRHKISPHFDEVVGLSLNQTFARSINTSLTTIVVLLALLFLGGQTTKYFALILAIGMAIGTYSSLFLAAPLLVTWEKLGRKS